MISLRTPDRSTFSSIRRRQVRMMLSGSVISATGRASPSEAGLKQCILNRPPKPQTAAYNGVVQTGDFAPLSQALFLASALDHSIGALVSGLLLQSCPPAIIRPVPTRIVYALKALPGRAFAHVLEKRVIVVPAWVHRDAAPAIVRPSRVAGALTPPSHPLPNLIGARLASTMGAIYCAGRFSHEATARGCQSSAEQTP